MTSGLEELCQKKPWIEWLIPVMLCTIFMGQLLLSARQISQTADEPTHLFAGYRFLKCGDLTISPEHPPLPRIIAAAPLLATNPPVDCTPFQGADLGQSLRALHWFYSQDWQSTLLHARVAESVFSIALFWAIWIAARMMFGLPEAIIAGALVIFDPVVLANGNLVMTDMPVTAMLLVTVIAFYSWTRERSIGRLLLAGTMVGLTLLSKDSGAIAIPIILVLAAIETFLCKPNDNRLLRSVLHNLLSAGLICFVSLFILWAGYGMRFSAVRTSDRAVSRVFFPNTASGNILRYLEIKRLLPQAYLEGFASTQLKVFSSEALSSATFFSQHMAPLLRMVSIQFTLGYLGLILLGATAFVLCSSRLRKESFYLLIPAAMYIATFVYSSWNGGVRHLLPALPFLMVLVAAGTAEIMKKVSWTKYLVVSLMLLHAASSVHAYPNHLSYANELWGGPKEAYRHVFVDLGQGYWQVRDYIEKHPTDDCWLLTSWQWSPEPYGVHCQAFGYPWRLEPTPPRMHGTVIISSALLTSPSNDEEKAAFETFNQTVPSASIGGSAMLVFNGDFDTHSESSLTAQRSAEALLLLARYNPQMRTASLYNSALNLAEYSVNMQPSSISAHMSLAEAMMLTGLTSDAVVQLQTARSLAAANPSAIAMLHDIDNALGDLEATSFSPR